MATVGIQLGLEVTDLKELQKALGQIFKAADKAKIVKDALTKAIAPTEARLKQIAPLGPTGNLRRAVASKITPYNKSGNAVAIVGFRRADKEKFFSAQGGSVRKGPDLAYHQYWLERGTKERPIKKFSNTPFLRRAHDRTMKSGVVAQISWHSVKGQGGYIASSFNRLGGFKGFVPTPYPPRGSGEPHRVQTEPGYPNAFFRKSKDPIRIPPMPIGGSTGQPPLETAWNQTQATVAEILSRELNIALSQALDSLTRFSGTLENPAP
jgi:hypothetical protein